MSSTRPRRTSAALIEGPLASASVPLVGLVLPGREAREKVAGVPLVSRATILLRRAGCETVVLDRESAFGLEPLPERADLLIVPELPRARRFLVVAGDVVFGRGALERLLAREGDRAILAANEAGFVLLAPADLAGRVARAFSTGGVAGARSVCDGVSTLEVSDLYPATSERERAAATTRLLRATGKAEDGPLTRLFERRISQAISACLLPFPVSPNTITTVSLLIGLAGAALLSFTGYEARVAGSALFLFATIVDGCDGEVSRVKLLESRFGKVYDTAVDIVVNLAVFLAIALGVSRELDGVVEVRAGALFLVLGGALSMLVVESLRRLLPTPPPGSALARVHAWVERFATLEWSYFVLALSLVNQLPLFFFGAAVGANIFALTYVAFGVATWLRG